MSAPERVVEPLAPAVMAELAQLPNGGPAAGHRAWLLAGDRRFREAMRRVESLEMPPAGLAELWLWLIHLTIDGGSRAATTGQTYALSVGGFLAWVGAEGVDHRKAITADFDRWQRWLAVDRGHGHAYRAQQAAAVRNFYDWRRSRGLAEKNAAGDLRAPRPRPKPPRKYTTEQLQALFRAVAKGPEFRRGRDLAILLLLLSTGMRREEITRLSLEDLELTRRTGLVRIDGKGAKEREVPFEGPVVDALLAWLQERESMGSDIDPDAVFLATTGPTAGKRLSMKAHEEIVSRHAKAAKLRSWGMHRFRVTYATQLYDDGAGIEEIRALMGHESIETTRRYLAVSDRARKTRLKPDRQHKVLGTKPTGEPMWVRMAMGDIIRG